MRIAVKQHPPIHLLVVGHGMDDAARRLSKSAPGIRATVAKTAVEGETYLADVDAVVIADRVRPAYLTAPRLRWLHLIGAGADGFSIAGLRDAPFVVTHKVEASVVPMAEHVMAQILLISRRALEYRSLQEDRHWARHDEWPTTDLIELKGKTLGIVGLGHAGIATARRAKAFEMRVIGTKRTVDNRLPNVDRIYPASELQAVLGQSDFVAILAPLTDETHRMIGEPELRAMKPTAYLINISRGPIVQEGVLERALRDRWIAGASLDVFEHEPLDPASSLWTLPNVIVTPHC
jgi:phosphoglycerate dehydrogenase-like enzyme